MRVAWKALLLGSLCIWSVLLLACSKSEDVQKPTTITEPFSPVEPQVTLFPSPVTPTAPLAFLTPTPWRVTRDFIVEEHPLRSAPTVEPLYFEPLAGTFAQIRARHAHLREQVVRAENSFFDPNGNYWGYWVEWQGQRLELVEHVVQSSASPEASVSLEAIVRLGDQALFTYPLGVPGPFPSIQGFWSDGQNWIAEVVESRRDTEPSADGQSVAYSLRGVLIRNGEILNQVLGYEEIFGFGWLGEQPFYFYRKNGKIGINYAGHDIPLGFDEVPHYLCCSAGELNPWQARKMVAFFGRRAQIWYYVEAGLLDEP